MGGVKRVVGVSTVVAFTRAKPIYIALMCSIHFDVQSKAGLNCWSTVNRSRASVSAAQHLTISVNCLDRELLARKRAFVSAAYSVLISPVSSFSRKVFVSSNSSTLPW